MIVTIEAYFRKLWRKFSPDEWTTRLLNFPKATDSDNKHGLVMIQIDGLAHTQIQRALKKGNMPFLARLLKNESYTLHPHYSGLPSNTPSVQGRLFYGVKGCVPAFSFKDSHSGKIFNMFSPECAAAVEDRLKEKGEALLKDGSAYGNIFTGGAKEAHFCASSVGWGSLLTAANPLGWPVTVLLHFHIFVRALFLVLLEFILAIISGVRGIMSGKKFLDELSFIPLRVAVCVLLRESIAMGAKIDIARGLPVIQLNLAGYDEQAHHRGPKSSFAHWSLRGIDSTIAKVWNAAQRSPHREYDVFIYSDHGQQETVNYQEEHGRSVEEAINQVLEENISSSKWKTEFSQGVANWRANLLRNKAQKKPEIKRPEVEKQENKEAPPMAVITTMGPIGHIYLPEPILTEEKEKIAFELITSAKIPIVMIRYGADEAMAWNATGKFILPREADKVIEASHPFFNEVVRDLVEICHHPDSGDLMIFGWRKGVKSLTFHTEQGSHAGPGPEETGGFALMPLGALPPSLTETISTQDLRDAAFRAQGRASKSQETVVVPPAIPSVLRIMTYNVHGCMGRDGKISPNRIAGIIAKHDPDIIALQELDASEESHQAQIIAQRLAMTHHYHPSLMMKKGRRGNAIFSKFPMKLVKNGSLPRLLGVPFLEPRGALWVEIDIHGLKVQVFNTHLSLSSRERFLQIKALSGPDWIGNTPCQGPVIFCGDLNSLSNSRICTHLGQVLANCNFGHRSLKTLPSFYPMGLVDHIFLGQGLKSTKIKIPKTSVEKMSSDHLPLIVDVQVESSLYSPDGKSSTSPDAK